MPAKKRKRKYTFRKGQTVPYESGSLMHEAIKAKRERAKKKLSRILSPSKKTSKKRK